MYCGKCGAERIDPDDQFCRTCGASYNAATDPQHDDDPPAAVAPEPAPDPEGEPFGSDMTLIAIAVTFFVPFIAIIVALVMRASESIASRRRFLKSWALWSLGYMCTVWLIGLLLISSIGGGLSGGGCKGGPDPFQPPSYISQGNGWQAIVPCRDGGTHTRPATKRELKTLGSP